MTKFLLTVFVFMIAFTSHAQQVSKNTDSSSNTIVQKSTQEKQYAIFQGCENRKTYQEQQICFGQRVTRHVSKKFNTDIAKKLGIKGVLKINTMFKVSEEGTVTNIRTDTKYPEIEEEVKRVFESIPKLKPALLNGEPISIVLSLPIVFSL